MSTLRLRRLTADFEKLQDFVERHPRLKLLRASGDPPELYQLEYRIRSLRQVDDDLQFVGSHTVEIVLPRDYPRMPPQCRMLTPVFHPNIAPHAICVGDHWSAGEPIGSIVARIGEMLAYQSYNTKSPLNGEAARWVEQHLEELPLDRINMTVDDSAPVPAQRARQAASEGFAAAPANAGVAKPQATLRGPRDHKWRRRPGRRSCRLRAPAAERNTAFGRNRAENAPSASAARPSSPFHRPIPDFLLATFRIPSDLPTESPKCPFNVNVLSVENV
jgi:ubiquitin-protein ligase